LAAIKSVIRKTETMDLESAYECMRSGEIEAYQKMLRSEDAKRGLSLFQKNDPQNGKENNKLEIGIINWSVFDRAFIK